ncbi:MAG: hypothetical protein LBR78_02715 [Holosporales bacterium]|jgi:hypothetical protein|nr:hypothetical protein [Holosporales bacterium]
MNSSSDEQKMATEDQDDEASIREKFDEFIRTSDACSDHKEVFISLHCKVGSYCIEMPLWKQELIDALFAEPAAVKKGQELNDECDRLLKKCFDAIPEMVAPYAQGRRSLMLKAKPMIVSVLDQPCINLYEEDPLCGYKKEHWITCVVREYIDKHRTEFKFRSDAGRQRFITYSSNALEKDGRIKIELLRQMFPVGSDYYKRKRLAVKALILIAYGIDPSIIYRSPSDYEEFLKIEEVQEVHNRIKEAVEYEELKTCGRKSYDDPDAMVLKEDFVGWLRKEQEVKDHYSIQRLWGNDGAPKLRQNGVAAKPRQEGEPEMELWEKAVYCIAKSLLDEIKEAILKHKESGCRATDPLLVTPVLPSGKNLTERTCNKIKIQGS